MNLDHIVDKKAKEQSFLLRNADIPTSDDFGIQLQDVKKYLKKKNDIEYQISVYTEVSTWTLIVILFVLCLICMDIQYRLMIDYIKGAIIFPIQWLESGVIFLLFFYVIYHYINDHMYRIIRKLWIDKCKL